MIPSMLFLDVVVRSAGWPNSAEEFKELTSTPLTQCTRGFVTRSTNDSLNEDVIFQLFPCYTRDHINW